MCSIIIIYRMLYLYLNKNNLKLLYLKKSLLSQYDVNFFQKEHRVDLLQKGAITNVDFVASAIKEAVNFFSPNLKDKEVFLILPQEAFSFFRVGVPIDIAPSAMRAFIQDKARSQLEADLEECSWEYFVTDSESLKQINFFALNKQVLTSYLEVLTLLDLRVQMILPETLTYFKLFEKTLRKEKKENIVYGFYEKSSVSGYLYDTLGLVEPKKWEETLDDTVSVEQVLKTKFTDFQEKGSKINRLILAGSESENVRQDTFTKAVGVWTNPLKRIMPQFYQDYIKLLIPPKDKQFPLLSFDACFGAFIFSQENKDFSFFKQGIKKLRKPTFSLPTISVNLPKKEVFIFILSFVASFGLFFLFSRFKFDFKSLTPKFETKTKVIVSPVKSPTPTPTPQIKREKIKIKILNGSGTSGKASDVKSVLTDKGYQEILTANADNFDYEQSEIQVKKTKSETASIVTADLKEYVTTFKQTTLAEKEAADVVMIIGKDFK